MLGKGKGGIENSFLNYTRCFLMNNHQVHVIISPSAAIEIDIKKLKGIHLHYLKNFGKWDVLAKIKLKKILRSIQADVVFAHANRALSFTKKLQKNYRIIGVVHNYSIKQAVCFRNIITVNHHLKTLITAKCPTNTSIAVLSNVTKVPSLKHRVNVNSVPVIGVLGRFVEDKGFDYFIKALVLLKKRNIAFNAILAGSGEQDKILKRLVDIYGLHDEVEFPGWVSQDMFFNQIDLFCLPSLNESFGIVLIEAFSYAKPVVSTNTQGPTEIIQDGINGLLVEKNNEYALADKLELLIKDKVYANVLARNGKQTFLEQYTFDVIAQQLERIINPDN